MFFFKATLVAYIVKKHYFESKEPDDLISIGTIGLIRAAETFNPGKNISFSTYASKCIDNQIKVGRLLRNTNHMGRQCCEFAKIRFPAWRADFIMFAKMLEISAKMCYN
jgi:DNA-directed RNA polymerase specialized sigma subunit